MATVTVLSLLAGMANLAGGWCSLWLARSRAHRTAVLALGAGFLLGGALLIMIPRAVGRGASGPLYVAAGFFGFLLLQQVALKVRGATGDDLSPEAVWAATLGMGLHSFFEGAVLALAIHVGRQVGALAAMALFLHKLPEGFTLAALVLAATGSRSRALLLSGLVGAAMLLGAGAAALWAQVAVVPTGALLGITAGVFLYVGAAEMLPAARRASQAVWLLLLGALLAHATSLL